MIHVAPQDIDQHWNRVRAGLERILRRFDHTWKPEHVYVALANQTAHLALIDKDAFLIWSRYPGDDMQGLLHIWCCEGQGLKQHKDTTYKELEEMARLLKCRTIRLIGRKGWGRDAYWKPAGYVYEHEVTNG